mmetsp:Transcript_72043/g.201083  ORF Transcript_72043/g.201083 Transcript_72043/m.201083 type:complete len:234 (+) Transcript_72043:585-1286(+)
MAGARRLRFCLNTHGPLDPQAHDPRLLALGKLFFQVLHELARVVAPQKVVDHEDMVPGLQFVVGVVLVENANGTQRLDRLDRDGELVVAGVHAQAQEPAHAGGDLNRPALGVLELGLPLHAQSGAMPREHQIKKAVPEVTLVALPIYAVSLEDTIANGQALRRIPLIPGAEETPAWNIGDVDGIRSVHLEDPADISGPPEVRYVGFERFFERPAVQHFGHRLGPLDVQRHGHR